MKEGQTSEQGPKEGRVKGKFQEAKSHLANWRVARLISNKAAFDAYASQDQAQSDKNSSVPVCSTSQTLILCSLSLTIYDY